MYINNPGHITKMAAMPLYGKFFKNLQNWWTDSTKLGLQHWGLVYYNMYNVMILTYFTAGQHRLPKHLNVENCSYVI